MPIKQAQRTGISGATSVQTNITTMTGTDRIFYKDYSPADLPIGREIYTEIIDCTISKRLSILARAFERVRFKRLAFRISPKGASVVNGGYVAAFLADADDTLTSIEAAMATTNSQSGKWWEARILVPRLEDKLLYTFQGTELRLRSPGKIYVFSDGSPDTKVPLTIDLEWTVELSQPGYEEATEAAPTYELAGDIYAYAGSADLTFHDQNQCEIVQPIPPVNTTLRLPFPLAVEYSEGSGDTGTRTYLYIHYSKKPAGFRWSYGDWFGNAFSQGTDWQSNVARRPLAPGGTVLNDVTPKVSLASSSLASRSESVMASGSSGKPLEDQMAGLAEQVRALSEKLDRLTKSSSRFISGLTTDLPPSSEKSVLKLAEQAISTF